MLQHQVRKKGEFFMASLPIPAVMFFQDFFQNLIMYTIFNGPEKIGSYKGLPNDDEYGSYIGFLVSDNPPIKVGYKLISEDNLEAFVVTDIKYDRYAGTAELKKVYC